MTDSPYDSTTGGHGEESMVEESMVDERRVDERTVDDVAQDVAPEPPADTAVPHDSAPEGTAPGDRRVRDAVRRLDELSDLPTAEHVEIYESVHRDLQESLAEAAQQTDVPTADGNPPP